MSYRAAPFRVCFHLAQCGWVCDVHTCAPHLLQAKARSGVGSCPAEAEAVSNLEPAQVKKGMVAGHSALLRVGCIGLNRLRRMLHEYYRNMGPSSLRVRAGEWRPFRPLELLLFLPVLNLAQPTGAGKALTDHPVPLLPRWDWPLLFSPGKLEMCHAMGLPPLSLSNALSPLGSGSSWMEPVQQLVQCILATHSGSL